MHVTQKLTHNGPLDLNAKKMQYRLRKIKFIKVIMIGATFIKPAVLQLAKSFFIHRMTKSWWNQAESPVPYFVKIFSIEMSERENLRQSNAGSNQGFIASLGIQSVGQPFWIYSPVGEVLSRNVPFSNPFISQLLVLSSTCEVPLRKRFQKLLVNAEFLEF